MKIGLHYSFQSMTQEWAALYRNCLEQIVLADRLNFGSISVAEHHFYGDGWMPSPLVACAAIAGCTKKVRMGTNILILPLYNPIKVAEDATVVDLLSGGRFFLGVGLGVEDKEYEAFGTNRKQRRERLEEGFELVKRLMTEDHVTHSGRFWKCDNLTITPKAIQKPHPPFWFGGVQEPAIVRAAEQGDAWCPSQIESMKTLKEKYAIYKNALARVGKDFYKMNRPLRREAYVAKDSETAWQEVREAIRIEYGEVYFKMGELRDENGNYMKPGEVEYEEVEEQLRRRFLIGSPDDMIERIEKIEKELEPTEFLFRMQLPRMPQEKVIRSITLIGEKVIPYFEQKG